jgi:hypothetical protein
MSRFTICTAEQRSPEWFQARLGRATGSKASCVTAKGKGNAEAVTRRDYRTQLSVERFTGEPEEPGYRSPDMIRGELLEPDALRAYEAFTGNIVRRTGFLSMRDYMAGCSLDADIDDLVGFAEIKCPKMAIHIEYIQEKRLPPEYDKQVTHNFWVTGAQWCDFVSYNNKGPAHLQVFVFRVQRNEIAIKAYEDELMRFLAEVQVTCNDLQQLRVAA